MALPKLNDGSEDLKTIRAIGGSAPKTVKAISEWLASGLLISDIAKAKKVSSQYLEEYWVKHTTPEFRAKTQRLQGDGFWAKALEITKRESNNTNSSHRTRNRAKMLSAEYKATAKLLHPEKWDPSMARKIAKANTEGAAKAEEIPFGIDQDLGDGEIAPHVRVLRGGITHDISPRYDDAFQEDTYDPRQRLTSRIITTRTNPFDSLDWKKLIKSHVATKPSA